MVVNQLFDTGKIVASPGALELLEQAEVTALQLIRRHVTGDWGVLSQEDKQMNEKALLDGSRIFSSYKVKEDKVWIVTEAEDENGIRPCTTILLPSEY